MALTRFHDGRTRKDGPVSGALIVMPIQFTNGVTGSTYGHTIDLPAGAELEIVDINVQSLGIANDPLISVGTTKGGTQIAAAVAVTTNLGSLTLKSTAVSAGGILHVSIVNEADETFDSISATITAYVSAPPTSVLLENRSYSGL